jgi:signal transduction histidine kinase
VFHNVVYLKIYDKGRCPYVKEKAAKCQKNVKKQAVFVKKRQGIVEKMIALHMLFSHQKNKVSWLGLVSLCSLLALLCLQVYWLYGSYTDTCNRFVAHMEEALREACQEIQPWVYHSPDDTLVTAPDTLPQGRSATTLSATGKPGTVYFYAQSDTTGDQGLAQTLSYGFSASHTGTYSLGVMPDSNSHRQQPHFTFINLPKGEDADPQLQHIDSLYRLALAKRGLHVDYTLRVKKQDADDEPIRRKGYRRGSDIIVESEPLSTRYAFRQQNSRMDIQIYQHRIVAQVPFTPFLIFRQMAGILLLSVLLFFVIAHCLVYQLRVIRKQKTAAKMKNDFIANFTHELKTPIAVVYAALDIIEREAPGRDEAVAVGKKQLKRLSDSVEKILSLSVEEHQPPALHPEDIVLNRWLPSLLEAFLLPNDRQITFEVRYTPEPLTATVDKLHLANVLNTIIDNAVKYAGNPVHIAISCHRTPEALTIAVQDNGPGIAPQELKKIFDRFYRGSAGAGKVQGFGLGLHYAQTLVALCGGTLTAHSQPGQGSCFVLTIPQKK